MIEQNPSDSKSERIIHCRVCECDFPISDFYENHVRRTADLGECKTCTKARVRSRARLNGKVQEYERQRAKTPKARARSSAIVKRWRMENPAGYAAHNAVSNAVRNKTLSKEPCVFCMSPDVHAHHRDYSRPLDVIWLCPKCHTRLHALFPETEGKNKSEPAGQYSDVDH